jgi:acetyl-CoA carboxylase biotin carboxyl carrier protein
VGLLRGMGISVTEGLADQLGELLRLLDGSDVEELEVEHRGARFVVRRDLSEAQPVARVAVERPAPSPRADSFVITAPVVGVFRRNAGGKGEAILDEGDAVIAGQIVGAVEAMGMLNRIQSERAGVVQEMLVRDGQPVEYGQPLLVVREP